MSTALDVKKITLQWPAFAKQPINSFKLPESHLSFRLDIAEQRDLAPEDYVGYEVDLNSDELFYQYLYGFQSKEKPFLYLALGDSGFDVLQKGGGYSGGIYVSIAIARIQNIPSVTDVRNCNELEQAVQHIFDEENDGEMLGPDFCWITVEDKKILRENATHKRSDPRYIFSLPIDHRHILTFNCSFGGYVPIGEPLPQVLFDALMDGVKEFLSYVQLEKIEG